MELQGKFCGCGKAMKWLRLDNGLSVERKVSHWSPEIVGWNWLLLLDSRNFPSFLQHSMFVPAKCQLELTLALRETPHQTARYKRHMHGQMVAVWCDKHCHRNVLKEWQWYKRGGDWLLFSGCTSEETAFKHLLRMSRTLNRPAEKKVFQEWETFIKARGQNRSICLCLFLFCKENRSKSYYFGIMRLQWCLFDLKWCNGGET